ncbi:MAG: DUF3152 domain-containing protein [Candidatus Nanopelagicales bacterium]
MPRSNVPVLVAATVVTVATLGWTMQEDPDPPSRAGGPAPTVASVPSASSHADVSPTPTPSAQAPSPSPLVSPTSPYGEVPAVGNGQLEIVPGSVAAPGTGPVKTVRVESEGGLGIDGMAIADEVMTTLNEPRSWGAGGRMTFARTDGDADIRLVLASPDTSAALCSAHDTGGRLSCAMGNTAIITLYRWVYGSEGYGTDIGGYRQYVVNHEVGHVLGHGHVGCPAAGQLAPVMVQQTKGLQGCAPNPWPYPDGIG